MLRLWVLAVRRGRHCGPRQLRDLQQAWEAAQRAEPQLVVLWGRRRVGKTFLLTHFAAGKRHVYFTGTRQDSERRQVDRYAMAPA